MVHAHPGPFLCRLVRAVVRQHGQGHCRQGLVLRATPSQGSTCRLLAGASQAWGEVDLICTRRPLARRAFGARWRAWLHRDATDVAFRRRLHLGRACDA